MIGASTNYYWVEMTSGVLMLVFIGHLSKTNYVNCFYYLPQRSWGKVMFLDVSVISFTGRGSAQLHAGIQPLPPRTRHPPD